jgi:TRAP-type C4-dicarboxylate transport system permease small subunit
MKPPENRVRRLVLFAALCCIIFVAMCAALSMSVVESKRSFWAGTEDFQLELGPRKFPAYENSIVLVGPGPYSSTCTARGSVVDLIEVSLRYWDCEP